MRSRMIRSRVVAKKQRSGPGASVGQRSRHQLVPLAGNRALQRLALDAARPVQRQPNKSEADEALSMLDAKRSEKEAKLAGESGKKKVGRKILKGGKAVARRAPVTGTLISGGSAGKHGFQAGKELLSASRTDDHEEKYKKRRLAKTHGKQAGKKSLSTMIKGLVPWVGGAIGQEVENKLGTGQDATDSFRLQSQNLEKSADELNHPGFDPDALQYLNRRKKKAGNKALNQDPELAGAALKNYQEKQGARR